MPIEGKRLHFTLNQDAVRLLKRESLLNMFVSPEVRLLCYLQVTLAVTTVLLLLFARELFDLLN